MMQVHLFSDSGDQFLGNVIEACHEVLAGVKNPTLAFLPAASVDDIYFAPTRAALEPLGSVVTLDTRFDTPEQLAAALESASVLFMPGGNTYLLSQRLHQSGLFERLRARARAGMPLVAVSAGSVICGLNMLTTNDMNCCASTEFEGLALAPYNLNVHYPGADGPARALRIERLWEFHHFYDQPVIMLEDSAHLRVDEIGTTLVRGTAWRLERGLESPIRLTAGDIWSG